MSTWSSGAGQPVEPDKVPVGKAVLVAVIVLAVFVAGIFFAAVEQRAETGTVNDASGGPVRAAGQQQVGMVDQPDYELGSTAGRVIDAQRAKLESWGWTDRAHGRIHEPIERAMDAIATGTGPGEPK